MNIFHISKLTAMLCALGSFIELAAQDDYSKTVKAVSAPVHNNGSSSSGYFGVNEILSLPCFFYDFNGPNYPRR